MGDVVNLNRARKARTREKAQAIAAENRILFGRTKAEQKKIADERERQRKLLDGHSLTERDEK